MSLKISNIMSGDQGEVEKKKKTLFWPLNLLPGLTHVYDGTLSAHGRLSFRVSRRPVRTTWKRKKSNIMRSPHLIAIVHSHHGVDHLPGPGHVHGPAPLLAREGWTGRARPTSAVPALCCIPPVGQTKEGGMRWSSCSLTSSQSL